MNKLLDWISQDICFCASNNCPIKEYCFRFVGCKSQIYTASYLAEVCNYSNVFEYFIQAPMDLVEQKRQQRKKDTGC